MIDHYFMISHIKADYSNKTKYLKNIITMALSKCTQVTLMPHYNKYSQIFNFEFLAVVVGQSTMLFTNSTNKMNYNQSSIIIHTVRTFMAFIES